MSQAEILLVGLLVAVVGLTPLARALAVPYPIVLVLGGAALGFVPGLPEVRLEPEVVLIVFLPPLLYGEAIFANWGDFRADVGWLTFNTVALVLVTMAAVAVAAHALAGLPWAAAFVLGAIVSPTDPVAAANVMERLGAPRRLVSAVRGEGLFNDATALVAYRVAVAAVVAGSFSLGDAGLKFLLGALGGVAIGLAVGAIAEQVRKRTPDVQVNVTTSLLTGYAAYVPADAIGASGVLAAVTAGIFMGIRAPHVLAPRVRLQGYFVWDILDFVVNAILFVLIGLQLRAVVDGLAGFSASALTGYAMVVVGVVMGTRLVWFLAVPRLVWTLDRRPGRDAGRVGTAGRFLVAWSGMRGAVSLAVALAIPLTTDAGDPFPQRDLIVFLTFAVIFATLVGQGLTLPGLIGHLRLTDDAAESDEEIDARLAATNAALAELDALAAEDWTRQDTIDRLRRFHEYRKRRYAARAGKIEDSGYEDRTLAYQRTLQRLLAAQRAALLHLRDDGHLSNEAMNRILRELDLEESRLEI